MVLVTAAAQRQIDALVRHYERLDRELAIRRLGDAIARAKILIEDQAQPFLAAPRPYPELADGQRKWIKAGRYRIGFREIPGGFAITAVFYDTSDIPGRV